MNARSWLLAAEAIFPRPAGTKAKHNITLGEDGSLELSLIYRNLWEGVTFPPGDEALSREPLDVLAEVCEQIQARAGAGA